MNCPCGSNKLYQECCEPYLLREKNAPSPEELMRSRYTAFTQANIDYIVATMQEPASKGFDPVSAKIWAQQVQWLGLEVVNAPLILRENKKGFVEFIARYELQGQKQQIHEISEFHLKNGRWYYVDGKTGSENAHKRVSLKTGRNDPCPCTSGKKYKQCCGK